MLVLSLSIHFFFFHGMFDSNVICFEENGSANIEYSIDGKTCIDHNNEYGDNTIAFTSVENNNCKDVSFSELNHNDDRFVVKKINKSISNVNLCSLITQHSVQQIKIEHSSIDKNGIKISSQLDSYTTVLLLI